MAVPKGVWGIDIGQCALKALRVELHDGQVTATGFDYIEHPKILSQPDADPDQLTREALDQFLSRNSLKGDFVAVAVPGQAGLARFVKLPPVEEKKVGDIVKFEAKQQIPFPLEEVVWDFQKIGSGEVADGFALETEIGLFAMKRDIIARSLQHYLDVAIEVDAIQMTPLALCNYLSYDLLGKGGSGAASSEDDETPRGKKKCVVGLDIGADASNLVVTDGDKVIWQRPIPLGGNHLTRALSKELKLTFAKAEHLKRNAAKSPPDLKQILAALRPVLTDLVGEVQRSLGYFTGQHRDAHVAYLVGLGSAFRLPGLQKYLSEKLGIEVKKPTKFERLHGDEVTGSPVFSENLLGFAVCYGLAVQGAKALAKPGEEYAKLTTNLLPPEIRQERMIRAKKPWAVAAAAIIFAGAGLLTCGYAWNYKAVTHDIVKEGLKQAETAMQAVSRRAGEVKTKDDEVNTQYTAVISIIAGKEEQLNWLRLNEYINKALPRPDGANLKLAGDMVKPGGHKGENGKQDEMVPDQLKYWRKDLQIQAMRDYYDRIRGGESADAPVDEMLRENLCHVDIEAIHTYFSPNLAEFIKNARKETMDKTQTELDGILDYDLKNPPADNSPGWVIALHGTTYQKDGAIFLRDTLVYNLARFCQRNFAGGTAPATPAPADANKAEDPIVDKVTHAFLYNCWTVDDPKPGTFVYINTNFLKPLVATGAPDPGGTGQTPPPTAAGGRETWQPLAAGPGGAMGGGGGPPMPTFGGPPMSRGRSGGEGILRNPGLPMRGANPIPAPGAPGAPDPATGAQRAKPRYEFVVMFIWREPTPSDLLVPATPNP